LASQLTVIVGASGHVGFIAAQRLLEAGRRIRAVGRDARKLEPLASRGAEIAAGSVEDPAFLAKALAGATAAYLLLPPNPATPDFRGWQVEVARKIGDALREAKVPHAVTLSSIGADRPAGTGPIVGLHHLEQAVNAAVPNTLHLRAGYFLENHLGTLGLVKGMGFTGGMIRGDLPMAQIASRDIGEVAGRRLTALDFTGENVLELQGARDVTMNEVAAALGKAIGKPDLRYVQFDYGQGTEGLVQAGLPRGMAQLYAEMSRGFNEGVARMGPRSAATTTPTTVEWFAEQVFAPAFRAA
jgi:uncharacterized protein YbjT (DUF2867 family)